MLSQLAISSPDSQGYALDKGLIRYNGRLWIANNSALQAKLISALHDSAIGGHSGARATYQRVKGLYYWPGMKKHIEEWAKQCQVCQQAKHENNVHAGLQQPLLVQDHPWVAVTMDRLPQSDRYDTISVVVDRLTKYAHFIPLRHPFTATTVAMCSCTPSSSSTAFLCRLSRTETKSSPAISGVSSLQPWARSSATRRCTTDRPTASPNVSTSVLNNTFVAQCTIVRANGDDGSPWRNSGIIPHTNHF